MNWFAHGRPPRWFVGLGNEQWSQGAHCVELALTKLGMVSTGWRRSGKIALGGAVRNRLDVHVGPLLRDTFHPYPEVWYLAVHRELKFLAERAPTVLRATTEEDRLRPLLLPALVPARETLHLPDALVRPWSNEVAAVLCARAPEGTRQVTGADVRRLDVDPAVLWTAARHNLRAEPLEEGTAVPKGTDMEVNVMGSNDRFGLSQLLRLGELLPDAARNGVLVGVIGSPGLFACHEVVRRDQLPKAVRFLELMIAREWYDPFRTEFSGVYWWKDGLAETVRTGDGAVKVSSRMMGVLDKLSR
ncbi:hypothetical protein [Streptomyces sp. NPDC057199]|uniref:hypothetical protein n=1 Tax=Streptomyces sp. NPDC057199 TaxID=3346047 RepID=UPI003641F026